MKRTVIFETERTYFSLWNEQDEDLAFLLWGNPDVTRYICASGVFTPEEVRARLKQEIQRYDEHGIQYFPFFAKDTEELIGVCGLRPRDEMSCELGFHLRPEYWHQGYAAEAASMIIFHAFHTLRIQTLFAGHNPKNTASSKVLKKLGFIYTHDEYYPPTGLNHPSYILEHE